MLRRKMIEKLQEWEIVFIAVIVYLASACGNTGRGKTPFLTLQVGRCHLHLGTDFYLTETGKRHVSQYLTLVELEFLRQIQATGSRGSNLLSASF